MDSSHIIHNGSEYIKLDELKAQLLKHEILKQKYESIVSENRKLREKSEIDPLTKVYCRGAAIERINKYLASGTKSSALIVLDLDNFKSINDTFGHTYGDAIITTASECMHKIIGNHGIIGRFGGDEFLIFMPDADAKSAMKAADDIIEQIMVFEKKTDSKHPLACSAGVAIGTGRIKYGRLFSMADKALYSAKQNGKSHAELFVPEMDNMEGVCITYVEQEESCESVHGKIVSHAIEMASKAPTTDEAVKHLMTHIHENFSVARAKILAVDITQDMISVVYDYNFNINDTRRIKNTVGYYLHKDLITFRDSVPDRRAVRMEDIDDRDYSEKFRKEFRDSDSLQHLYYMNKTSDGNYTICYFESENPPKDWSNDDCAAISEIASIVMVYSDKVRNVSQRELVLQNMLVTDKLTGLFTLGHFFEQSGLIRKLAFENDLNCYVIYSNMHDTAVFNKKYSYDEGDALLKDYSNIYTNSDFKRLGIMAHNMGRFYSLIRTPDSIDSVFDAMTALIKKFIEDSKKKYPDFDFKFTIGITEVVQNEILLHKIDKARLTGSIIE